MLVDTSVVERVALCKGECVCDLGTKAEAVVAAHRTETIASVENRGMVMNECSRMFECSDQYIAHSVV
jgi:hypothetical protein